MNTEPNCRKCSTAVTVLAVAGSFLVMAWLVWLMRHYTQPPSLAQARAEERLKIKQAFDEANAPLINTLRLGGQGEGDCADSGRARQGTGSCRNGRIPIAAHANLAARAAKAAAPAAPTNSAATTPTNAPAATTPTNGSAATTPTNASAPAGPVKNP
jgi:hypothetical protein